MSEYVLQQSRFRLRPLMYLLHRHDIPFMEEPGVVRIWHSTLRGVYEVTVDENRVADLLEGAILDASG